MRKLRGRLTKEQIDKWVVAGARFELRSDGNNLWLRYRKDDLYPRWVFRYSLNRKARTLSLGSYRDVSLSMARTEATRLRGLVAIGRDVAEERKAQSRESVASRQRQVTVGHLADQFFDRYVGTRLKHPGIVRSWIDNRIKPSLGKLPVSVVTPSHIDQFIQGVSRDAPTVAPKLLSRLKAIFNFGVKIGYLKVSPASAFDASDAGNHSKPRDRWLTDHELTSLMRVMRTAKGWNIQNTLTVRLLLMLAVRKNELLQARVEEFNLVAGTWSLPAVRTKANRALEIPLPKQAVDALRQLLDLASGSEWLLPARKAQTRLVGHISSDTINAGLQKAIRPLLSDLSPFTVHDFRRTARTHLEALGVDPYVAERCLNHSVKGLIGVYNRHDYFEQRKVALQQWADHLDSLDRESRSEGAIHGEPA
jgi:integrase